MRSILNITFVLALSCLHSFVWADELPKLSVTAIASGTVNWELQHIKNEQLDIENGYELIIHQVASLSAARIAITSGNTHIIVSDWLWASDRNSKGSEFRFLPFSKQIGAIMLAKDSKIATFSELAGKKIGVAGGPSNKGWVLLQAAAKKEGIDLQKQAQVQFAAPPLLSQALKSKRLDVLVTFWHYGARLEAEGFKKMASLEGVMKTLGLASQVPMLGYLFDNRLLQSSPELIAQFNRSISQAKSQLASDNQHWDTLRPLMRAESEVIYQSLILGYRNGIPAPLSAQQIKDAKSFYGLIDKLKQYPTNTVLDTDMFYLEQK